MREKKRYLAFEILSKSKIEDFSAVSGQIKASMTSFIGELESAKAGLYVMGEKWNKAGQKGIIRVKNGYVRHVMASLALLTSVKGKKAMARSLGVSGMLRKAERYIVM